MIALAILAAIHFHAGAGVDLRPLPRASAFPAQVTRWHAAKVNPRYSIQLDQLVALYRRHAATYTAIARMRSNGVPATVVFGLHYRESDNDFKCHPHEGSPLTHRTRYVPRGRPLTPEPPYPFLVSAEDAYYSYEHLERKDWQEIGAVLEAVEGFNGTGYKKRGVPSPYVWSGSDQCSRGKYVADGRYDASFLDKQLGVAAILLRMRERGLALPFIP